MTRHGLWSIHPCGSSVSLFMPPLRSIWESCLPRGHGQQEEIFSIFTAFPFPTRCFLYSLQSGPAILSYQPKSPFYLQSCPSVRGIKVPWPGVRRQELWSSSNAHLGCHLPPLCLRFFILKRRVLN